VSTQRILRETLESMLASDDTFPSRFYELLFERHPDLRGLFKSSTPNVQRLKFAQSLVWIVDHADQPEALERELRAMADRHRGYGVTDEMYAFVGEALLDTLQEALGGEFTPEVEQAWRGAYTMISTAMRGRTGLRSS
jgi:hemoglobin-like flavoprotein